MDYDENYEKKYYSDIVESAKFIKKDKSVKTIEQAWKRLKKAIKEFAEEHYLRFEVSDAQCYVGNLKFDCYIDKNFSGGFDIRCHEGEIWKGYASKEYNRILFILYWYIKEPSDKNIELLHKTREQMELEYLKNKKLKEINSAVLSSCLDALYKENKLKYSIAKDKTSCILTFWLRPNYKLQVKLLYSELPTQLAELNDVIKKAIEISSSSLVPTISCNRSINQFI